MSMRIVAASATACLCACLGPSGAGAGAARSLGQPAAPLDWATQLLGTPPRSISVVRPYPGSDSLERDESPDPSPADYAMFHSQQADAYSQLGLDERTREPSLEGDILVLHAVPPWLDPLRPYPRTDQAPGWSLVATAPSGVRTYRGTREAHHEPVELFVLPSSTWILATGAAAQRLGWTLASNAVEPPYLDAMPGIFEQTTASVDGAGLAREGKCWVRDCTHVVAAGLALYAPSEQPVAYGAFLVFPDEGSARDAATDAQRLLADPATRERLIGRTEGSERYGGVKSVGRAVVFLTAVENRDGGSPRAEAPAPKPRRAPDSDLASINVEGATSLTKLRGKVVLMHFWGTWAADAKSEHSLASLQRLADKYGSAGLEVVGVAEETDASAVLQYARDHGLKFRLVLDGDGAIKRSWAPDAFPVTYVVDQNGDVRSIESYLHLGDVDDQEVEREVRALLPASR